MTYALDAEKVSESIGAIYDCALDTRNWPNAISMIAEQMDSSYGMLFRANPVLGVVQTVGQWGLNRSSLDALENEWAYKLPVMWHLADAPLAEPFKMEQAAAAMSIANLWEQPFFSEFARPFFSEFARPFGFGDAAAVVLYRTEYRVLTLAMVSRSEEPRIGAERMEQLRIFVPHLQRAIRL